MQLVLRGGSACPLRVRTAGFPVRRCRVCSVRACSAPAGAVEYTLAQRDACSRYRESARPAEQRLLDDAFAVLLVRLTRAPWRAAAF